MAGNTASATVAGGQPAPAGGALGEVTTPPAGLISLVMTAKGFSGGDFAVKMRPFGWGPGGPSSGTLVIHVDSAKPLDANAKSLKTDFADKNVALSCDPAVAAAISRGGTYEGTMRVTSHGDVGTFSLVKVTGPR
jgi:hypothetical protein